MTRQAALQCLRSLKAKNASKPKLIWLANTKTTACASKLTSPKPSPCLSNNHTHGLVRTKILRPLSTTHHRHQFCTSNTVSSLKHLTVTRSEPELVGPAKPTPREVRQLSFMDDGGGLRMLLPMVQIYRYDPASMHGVVDPARAIREALARALVFYYPLAGRLREGRDGELLVDCTGEGVVFAAADADVELAQLGDPPQTHLPWFEDFLYNAPPLFGEILNSPLMYIQVTRLKCGSFILALRFNHIMCDGGGLTQFLTCVGEIARGAHTPSITPVWKRELFRFSNPKHRNADPPTNDILAVNNLDLAQRSIFLGPSELLAIRRLVPEHLRARATTFEILTAFLWRCHTCALELNLDQDDLVYLMFTVNARDKTNRVVPGGYYGNTFTGAVVESSARKVCERPIEYAIGLIKKAKEESAKVHMSWGTDTPIIGMDLSHYPLGKCLLVTDSRQLGYGDVDFGWGKPVYAGLAKCEMDGVVSYAPYGEDGIVASICLQAQTMTSFETEFNNTNASFGELD